MKTIGTFRHPRWGKVTALAASYNSAKGPLAVVLTSGGKPLATLSVNMCKPQCSADSKDLPTDCFYVKDWSENEDIAEHACEGMTVSEVLPHASVSRAQLEKKFRQYLGRTPQAEIRRVQIARIRQLLAESDLPLRSEEHTSELQSQR